jgi:E3 ubiquitin-protein ligase DOA10
MEDILILEDQKDAITVLKRDHRDLEGILEMLKSSVNPDEKFQAVQVICTELVNTTASHIISSRFATFF